ncbi:hypothetical protein EYF80_050598 [Liparis tanakae]|uniref:Uncharacterized protein n=1 Tax=Liparis tanakae TaxID=230148 RepID=A0A4Z2FEC7_9TELE|nr:hypothetical protein EYF80_050598 [Liparis tanakae]
MHYAGCPFNGNAAPLRTSRGGRMEVELAKGVLNSGFYYQCRSAVSPSQTWTQPTMVREISESDYSFGGCYVSPSYNIFRVEILSLKMSSAPNRTAAAVESSCNPVQSADRWKRAGCETLVEEGTPGLESRRCPLVWVVIRIFPVNAAPPSVTGETRHNKRPPVGTKPRPMKPPRDSGVRSKLRFCVLMTSSLSASGCRQIRSNLVYLVSCLQL